MNKKSRNNLVYATGLSIDKKRFNYITENINFDKDYSYFLNKARERASGVTSKATKLHISLKNNAEHIFEGMNIISKKAGTVIESIFGIPYSSKIITPIVFSVFDVGANTLSDDAIKKYKESRKTNKRITDRLSVINEKLPEYTNGDFFSLYLSHQSDSSGIAALSKLSARNKINLTPTYCDGPYYNNQYIDHVLLRINNKIFAEDINNIDKNNIQEVVNGVFYSHVIDIVFSKLIDDLQQSNSKARKKNTESMSFIDIAEESQQKSGILNAKDVIKSLAERNFFGISLLSMIIHTITKIAKETNFQNPTIGLAHRDDNKHSERYEFLKELIQMSSDPSHCHIVDENTDSPISARIYLSDGISLTSSEDELYNDEFIHHFYQMDRFINSHDKNTIQQTNEDKYNNLKVFYRELIKPTIETQNKEALEELDFIVKKALNGKISAIDFTQKEPITISEKFTYLKIPIKMVLSLPFDKDQRASSDAYLPEFICNNKQNIDILTIGGAEHNRALAHLINKHRFEYKDKRLFGFMDNYSDFGHKLKIDHTRNEDSANTFHNFFMGLNQPVSGWNYILNLRTDDSLGNSVNSDAKLIGFRLNNGNRKINILSIYGFSAIASVLGINLIVAEILQRSQNNRGQGLFESMYSYLMDADRNRKDRGSAATIFFYKSTSEIKDNKNNKNSLYSIMEKSNNKEVQELLQSQENKTVKIVDIIHKVSGAFSYPHLFHSNMLMYKKLFSPNKENNQITNPSIIHYVRRGRNS